MKRPRSPQHGDSPAERDYEVGYAKTPVHTRWSKGQSGNPRGPAKRPRSIGAAADKALSSKISVVDSRGRRRSIRAEEVIIRKFIEAALKGNLKAASFVMDRAERFRSGEMEETAPPELTDGDIEILESVLKRSTRGARRGESS